MEYTILLKRVEAIREVIEQVGGKVLEIINDEPATIEKIKQIETMIGHQFPISFKKVLLEYSSHFSFSWFLPNNLKHTDEFMNFSYGRLNWNIDIITQIAEEVENYIGYCAPDPDDEYDAVWHNKLAFSSVGNGDYLAFDLNDGDDAKIVYLSHAGGIGHGYKLAENFFDFLDKWSRVAFVGPDDTDWITFTENPNSGIISDGDVADSFRAWLKLDI